MSLKFSRASKQDIIFDLSVFILLSIALLLVTYPLYYIIIASFSDPDLVNAGQVLLVPKGFSFAPYRAIFQDQRIWTGYKNTLLYTSFGTTLNVILTLMLAYSLSRKDFAGRKLLMNILIFTMYFQGGLIPTFLLVKNIGLNNNPLLMVILGAVNVYNVIIARTFFESTISEELLEAAVIDGCGNATFFTKIVLPLSKALIAVLVMYYAVWHWNSFMSALIYLKNKKYFPLQLILRDILTANQSVQMEGADIEAINEMQRIANSIKYGVIIVSSLPVLVMYPFMQRYFVKGVMIGAVKG